MSVNSYHHQAVKEPASCLKVSAVSEDGLIEGLYAPGKRFLHAVQWHPELVWRRDRRCFALALAFVQAARALKAERRL